MRNSGDCNEDHIAAMDDRAGSAVAFARFGIVTDTHYADIEPYEGRYCRESLAKMAECVACMNDARADFMIELGDLINGAPARNVEHVRDIEAVFARFRGPRFHVLGNHDMECLSKRDFLSAVDNTGIASGRAFYSVDQRGLHVVVLDACHRADGADYDAGNFHWEDAHVPPDQLAWLDDDLAATRSPTIVCVHQLLDRDAGSHYVRNARDVRRVLNRHAHVLAVFQGHQHDGQRSLVDGIHYYTLRAAVEGSGAANNAYAVVEVRTDLSLAVTGYRRAESAFMASRNSHSARGAQG